MAEDFRASGNQLIQEAVAAELAYLRQLGANENLAFASANLGAFEALLIIIQNGNSILEYEEDPNDCYQPYLQRDRSIS